MKVKDLEGEVSEKEAKIKSIIDRVKEVEEIMSKERK
jgi:wobble nucleotide-excising tRNase